MRTISFFEMMVETFYICCNIFQKMLTFVFMDSRIQAYKKRRKEIVAVRNSIESSWLVKKKLGRL